MAAKHTPGTWSVSEVRCQTEVGETYMVLGGEGQDFGLIAEVTTEADAHLIAAAPRMRALIHQFKDFAKSGEFFNYPLGSLQEIDAVLAQSWGGS